MAKKLKKKHRPMTIYEWGQSTGGVFAATKTIEALDPDIDGMRTIAEDEEAQAVAQRMLSAYHDYVCAFIIDLLDKR